MTGKADCLKELNVSKNATRLMGVSSKLFLFRGLEKKQNKMASRFASRKFCSFAGKKVTILGWLFRHLCVCTVCGPVSGHKRRKHVFRTSEGLQSAEINTKSRFSIQETGFKLTAA